MAQSFTKSIMAQRFDLVDLLEKGESLQEWKSKTQSAFTTIVDALCLIADRLARLHDSGWVHHDLKPGNVLRLPGQHSWTLMDFGCAGRTGAQEAIKFSPAYAAPEVAVAPECGHPRIRVDPAADMWALGLIAFELITDEFVFKPGVATRESMSEQLCGWKPLLWEAGMAGPEQDAKLEKLQGLKRPILQCLQRLPEDRPTAHAVLRQWRTLLQCRTAAGSSGGAAD